jgi:hypothetical protein
MIKINRQKMLLSAVLIVAGVVFFWFLFHGPNKNGNIIYWHDKLSVKIGQDENYLDSLSPSTKLENDLISESKNYLQIIRFFHEALFNVISYLILVLLFYPAAFYLSSSIGQMIGLNKVRKSIENKNENH